MRPITATYRLQFNDHFTFDEARAHVPYIASLGISHVYASPIFEARPGSQHGYDVSDPTRINPELGGEAAFRSFVEAVHGAGLGLILDIVPNHMAADTHNPYWFDALAFGRDGPAGAIFDIDWSKPKILLPILGEELPKLISQGAVRLALDAAKGHLVIRHFDTPLPLSAETSGELLKAAGLPDAWTALGKTPSTAAIDQARGGLQALPADNARALETALANADVASILERQHWQLVPWQSASRELAYRRFFNITDLVGVRIEDQAVFDLVHNLPVSLVKQGVVDGLRVDHVDGLADPEAYCRRLRAAIGDEPLLVLEKILEGDEELRSWPVDGTTGYERLNDINGLFIDPEGYDRLDAELRRRGWLEGTPADRLAIAKRLMLETSFGSEMAVLVGLARKAGVTGDDDAVRDALLALLVRFPVYRSYATERGFSADDRAVWQTALDGVAEYEAASTDVARLVFEAVAGNKDDAARLLATRFQQLAGPAMAKGLEDTDFYRSVALTSANEVGGDLLHPGRTPDAFHAKNLKAPGRRDLVPLATHDTKRGADTRARIDVLSWDADAFVHLFDAADQDGAGLLQSGAPDGLDRWLILQTLIGTWPITEERLSGYLQKAMREAKRRSNWETPEEAYEAATQAYAKALLDGETGAGIRKRIETLLATLDPAARVVGIAQTILQLTVPGTPDIYQGIEFWDHSLVDPDNRRPFDWTARREALEGRWPESLAEDHVGASKIRVMQRLLALRRSRPELFQGSDYVPLALAHTTQRWVGYERRSKDGASLVVTVPTRTAGLGSGGSPTVEITGLPGGDWQDVIGGETFTVDGTVPFRIAGAWPFVVATRP